MAAADIDWGLYPALAASRALSRRLVAALRDDFEQLAGPGTPAFVAAAGSLGRLEAHAASDGDLLVAADGALADHVRAHIDATLAAQGLRASRPEGIYSATLLRTVLLDPDRRGSLLEPAGDFGLRMALLLDASPVSNDAEFRRWQRDVLEWYVTAPEGASWRLLIDDLGRYRHAYRCWQRFDTDLPAWALRQAKLEGSRSIGFAGLLLLSMQAAAPGEGGVDWMAGELARTPLERVVDAMRRCDIDAGNLLEAYAAVHGMLCDPTARLALSGDLDGADVTRLLGDVRAYGLAIRSELLRVFNALAEAAGRHAAMDALF